MKLTPETEAAYRKQQYPKSPSIAGVEVLELPRFADDGGSMTELGRLDRGGLQGAGGFKVAQVNYSTLEPGAIKAFHVHREQTDVWFVPPHDRVLLLLVDTREASATQGARMRMILGDGASRLVVIPPGVAHGCRNLAQTPSQIIYFADRQFTTDPSACDEGRLPWDFFGDEIWDPVPE